MGPNELANRRPARGRSPRMRDVRVERRVRLHRQPPSVVAYLEPLTELARQE